MAAPPWPAVDVAASGSAGRRAGACLTVGGLTETLLGLSTGCDWSLSGHSSKLDCSASFSAAGVSGLQKGTWSPGAAYAPAEGQRCSVQNAWNKQQARLLGSIQFVQVCRETGGRFHEEPLAITDPEM